MLYAGYSIKKSIDTLMNYKKMINQKTEIIKMQTRLDSELSSMLKFADELLNIIKNKGEYKTHPYLINDQ